MKKYNKNLIVLLRVAYQIFLQKWPLILPKLSFLLNILLKYDMYKRVGGTVIAYKNYTDYAGINDNGAGIVEKIVLRLLGAGRYHPQQSINNPTCDIDDLVEYKVPRYSPVRK